MNFWINFISYIWHVYICVWTTVLQGIAQSLQQLHVGSVISKYGSQCSKRLPTTNSLVQLLHIEMADKGAFTVYTATRKVFNLLQRFCKILYLYVVERSSYFHTWICTVQSIVYLGTVYYTQWADNHLYCSTHF